MVIDCNRPLGNPTFVPEASDGFEIPGNKGLTRAQLGERIEKYYLPYHFAIVEELKDFAMRGIEPFVFSVHSCTPVMNDFERPWGIGIAHTSDETVSRPLIEALREICDYQIGDNEPYPVDESDYTIIAHGLDRRLKHVLVEIRQDLIANRQGANEWGDRLYEAFGMLSLL